MDGPWELLFHPDFGPEFRSFSEDSKVQIGAVFDALRAFGPNLGRPLVDTLKGSRFPNMKEIRAQTATEWFRVAFAFDPEQRAIVLCGGTKGGVSQRRFYRSLIARADARYVEHLKDLKDDESTTN